jgi:hypothetical protein
MMTSTALTMVRLVRDLERHNGHDSQITPLAVLADVGKNAPSMNRDPAIIHDCVRIDHLACAHIERVSDEIGRRDHECAHEVGGEHCGIEICLVGGKVEKMSRGPGRSSMNARNMAESHLRDKLTEVPSVNREWTSSTISSPS